MKSTVLYAEDDLNDITLMELVVARRGGNLRLKVVRDGSQAIAYLKREGKFTHAPSSPAPAVILLDVKMPKVTGIEVLEWVRQQKSLSDVPVIMISSSMQEVDVLRSYELGANAYIGKPAAFKQFQHTVSSALKFFLARPGPGRTT
jgi:CheY-like chemotaxis protein